MIEPRVWKRAGWALAALTAAWMTALAVAQEAGPPPPPEGEPGSPAPGAAEALPPPEPMEMVAALETDARDGDDGETAKAAKDGKTAKSDSNGDAEKADKVGGTEAAPASSEAGGAPPAPPAAGAADGSPSAPLPPSPGGAEGSGASWEKYKVIAERNFFLRDRARRSDRLKLPSSATAERQPWQDIVLAGVSRVGGECVAFLEDTRGRTTTRARMGDEAGDGRIVEISLDHVILERNGQRSRVNVGSALSGETPPPARPAAPASAAPSAQDAKASPPAGAGASPAGQSILERLRQRRLQELNKK